MSMMKAVQRLGGEGLDHDYELRGADEQVV
jgi:hypothetical protein